MTNIAQKRNKSKHHNNNDALFYANQFLNLLDEDGTLFHFQVYDDKGDKDRGRSITGKLADVFDELSAWNLSGCAVAVGINEIKEGMPRKARNVCRVRAVFVDDDIVRKKPRKNFPLPPSIIVHSSPGKYHYYWLCDGIPVRAFKDIQRHLVALHGHDHKMTSPNAVLRLSGFLHQKGEPFVSTMVEATGKRYTAAEIYKAFPSEGTENSEYYRQQLPLPDLVLLKHGGIYEAEAIVWTYKAKNTLRIRYIVDTDKGQYFLDEYVQVSRLKKTGMMSVGKNDRLASDLRTLRPDIEYDYEKLPTTVIDEYFGRKVMVQVVQVKRKRDPSKLGAYIARPKSTWYSRVECVWEAIVVVEKPDIPEQQITQDTDNKSQTTHRYYHRHRQVWVLKH